MSQITCPKCRRIVDPGAFCSVCAAPLKRTSPGLILLIVGGSLCCLVLFVAVLGLILGPTIRRGVHPEGAIRPPAVPAKDWDSSSAKIEAFVMSQEFMKRRLKAPGSAEFPWYSDSEVSVLHRGNGVFQVNAYVDAQNSFGAKLRTRYACQLRDEGKQSWALISLTTK